EFYLLSSSHGDPFEEAATPPANPRAVSLKGQLDEMDKAMHGQPHKLATIREALHVQELIEAMLERPM
ncbi:MAG: gfo/Idh/MocA family oxidoreductase, partial [Pseudomonadota bacterium]